MDADLHGARDETRGFQSLAQGLAFKVQAANSGPQQVLKVRADFG